MALGDSVSSVFNPGSNKPIARNQRGDLATLGAQTQVNQIKGVQPSGGSGSGLPLPVRSNRTSTINRGTTTDVTALFTRNPADRNFQRVLVLVKNYNGNPQPVQVASATESPVRFSLNNTGENVLIMLQAQGNAGSHAIESSPTTVIKLPIP